jgi:hypothetical protein
MASGRYIIVEDFGCMPYIDYSPVYVGLQLVPKILLSFIVFILAGEFLKSSLVLLPDTIFHQGLAVRNLICHKLGCNVRSNLTTSRFLRLLIVCVVVGIWPLLSILLYYFLPPASVIHIEPWRGFAAMRKTFYHIPMISYAVMTPIAH